MASHEMENENYQRNNPNPRLLKSNKNSGTMDMYKLISSKHTENS